MKVSREAIQAENMLFASTVGFTPLFEEPGLAYHEHLRDGSGQDDQKPPLELAGFDIFPVDCELNSSVCSVLLILELLGDSIL